MFLSVCQNFATIRFAHSKFYCRGVSHEKQRFGRFSSLPQCPPPPPKKNAKMYFYCRRLAVSELFKGADLKTWGNERHLRVSWMTERWQHCSVTHLLRRLSSLEGDVAFARQSRCHNATAENIVHLTALWDPPPSVIPLKNPRNKQAKEGRTFIAVTASIIGARANLLRHGQYWGTCLRTPF